MSPSFWATLNLTLGHFAGAVNGIACYLYEWAVAHCARVFESLRWRIFSSKKDVFPFFCTTLLREIVSILMRWWQSWWGFPNQDEVWLTFSHDIRLWLIKLYQWYSRRNRFLLSSPTWAALILGILSFIMTQISRIRIEWCSMWLCKGIENQT